MPGTRAAAVAAARSARPLLVWDFDWSLLNANSDYDILPILDAAMGGKMQARLDERLETHGAAGWTSHMDWLLGELHANGMTRSQLEAALVSLPMLDSALRAVEAAGNAGAEQRILSDANDVYIETILAARGIAGRFGAVESNPAAYDASGRLRVRPHQPADAPHGCGRGCSANLCKGAVLDRWLGEPGHGRCIYVGDGSNDYCPATRLRPGDVLLARRFPHDRLLRKVRADPAIVATVVEWGGEAGEARADGAELLAGVVEGLATR